MMRNSSKLINQILRLLLVFCSISRQTHARIAQSDSPIVRTSAGSVRGKLVSSSVASYFAFKGIPYAEPPVGSLRFEPPVEKSRWIGVLESRENETRCLSPPGITEKSTDNVGSEDCLYLNVYTPSMRTFLLKAVMVFVQGNMFTSENSSDFKPERLVKNDVIVVTLSYRTSVFGFLSNGDLELSGNQALKDILMALKWVQKNIFAFMGNSRRVTIFGHSNGAALVSYLLLSEAAKGLFQRVIMQSGCALMPHFFQPFPQQITKELVTKLALNFTSTKEMVEQLKEIDAEKILQAMTQMSSQASPFLLRPIEFAPTIESPFAKAPFLTEPPLTRLIKGKTNLVNIMIGSVANEASFLAKTLENFTEIFDKFPHFIVPSSFELNETSSKLNATVSELQKIYFVGHSNGSLDEWLRVYTDQLYKFPVDRFVRLWAQKSFLPIYYYEFAFNGTLNYNRNRFGLNTTTHGDELFYLFDADSPTDIKSELTRERMTALWTNFAKDGDPTLLRTAHLGTYWLQYRSFNRQFYEINAELSNRNNFGRVESLMTLQRRLTGHF